MELALNSLKRLIYHKTLPMNQPTILPTVDFKTTCQFNILPLSAADAHLWPSNATYTSTQIFFLTN